MTVGLLLAGHLEVGLGDPAMIAVFGGAPHELRELLVAVPDADDVARA
jgi:hypothetical protein